MEDKLDRERIRSAKALLVFESAARCLSFTKAAEDLHVTQVAVSRMVARLEDAMGVQLFTRSRQGLRLTEDGALLQAAVSSGFSQMEGALREIRRRRAGRGTVTLSLTSGFVSHWLMPRYARFQQAVPNINLRFEVFSRVLQGGVEDVDLGLRMDDPERRWQAWPFCPEVVMPLCSPGYLRRHGALGKVKDLQGHTLIHLSGSPFDWEHYGAQTGLEWRGTGHSVAFSDGALALQAALIGEGVALGWLSATSGALRERLLVPASNRPLRTGRHYSLVAQPGPVREEVTRVREWLVAQMQDDLAVLAGRYEFLAKG
jgi:LysR family glycine cleavage system transcriptional activator